MRSTPSARLIVAIFAALAMIVLVSARAAYSQDAEDSAAGIDASLEGPGPAVDEDAKTADKVLEIPQLTCANDGISLPCGVSDEDADAGAQAINAPSPGAPPTLDDDTAAASLPNQDWGTLDDYQNQQAYGVPYAVYAYPMIVAAGAMNRPSPSPASAYVPMSGPLTQAARPPLNPGPWMMSPSLSPFSHPAGNPMMGMTMSHPLSGFHH
jgi:hypothetical protein